MKTKIAVISDVHANADALEVVLYELNSHYIDLTVCLGDILTYGCQPQEVIEILSEYEKNNPIVFIKGNHEQFYFDAQSGVKVLSYNLPEFVKESIDWTLKKISPLMLKDIFSWHNDYCIGNVYFSHSNPFEYADWSYIEKNECLCRAFQKLEQECFFAGVFGHSHRQLFVASNKRGQYKMNEYSYVDDVDRLIVNAGTVGHPRGKGIGYALLEMNNNKLYKASFKKMHVNLENSIRLVKRSLLSQQTKKILIDYLKV